MSKNELLNYIFNNNNIKELDIGNRVGNTSYIDFIKKNEVTENIMKGTDIYKRKFFIIKFKVDNINEDIIQIFFQRYSNKESLWMGCGNYFKKLLDTCGGMNEEQFSFLYNIIVNKKREILTEEILRTDNVPYLGLGVGIF